MKNGFGKVRGDKNKISTREAALRMNYRCILNISINDSKYRKKGHLNTGIPYWYYISRVTKFRGYLISRFFRSNFAKLIPFKFFKNTKSRN